MLPDGDGEVIVRTIKRNHPSTRIAVCSGAGETDRLKSVAGLGVEAVLRKPVDVKVLFDVCNATA